MGIQEVDNCFIAEIIATDGYVKHADDNIDKLLELFQLSIRDDGWRWLCAKCGKPAYSSEVWFDCKQCFVTTRVVCHLGCHNRWGLEISCKGSEYAIS